MFLRRDHQSIANLLFGLGLLLPSQCYHLTDSETTELKILTFKGDSDSNPSVLALADKRNNLVCVTQVLVFFSGDQFSC